MQNNNVYFVIFETIHDAMRADGILRAQGIDSELVPLPRQLRSDCGVCVRTTQFSKDLLSLISASRIDGCFVFDGKEYRDVG